MKLVCWKNCNHVIVCTVFDAKWYNILKSRVSVYTKTIFHLQGHDTQLYIEAYRASESGKTLNTFPIEVF